ncbi:hypothetical protein AXG93_4751s1140 [Marchantia polymorpha subsp. ruderalis]|uniref:Uncharacterized protein n=1 Tax=Marchantia polymorpha subsp. ruderalis TaxID=1480154 RepID=A0A176VE96_MARPO|nr:hypothetical protein AXG93_4751s1140 [Marchantia polymorpha subsp. ruderalis]
MLEDKLQDMAWRLSRVEVTSSKSECAHKSAQNDIAYRNLELKLEKARILQRVRMRRRRKKRKTEKRTRSWRTLMLCRRLSVEEVLIVKGGQGEHLDVVHGCFNKLFVYGSFFHLFYVNQDDLVQNSPIEGEEEIEADSGLPANVVVISRGLGRDSAVVF